MGVQIKKRSLKLVSIFSIISFYIAWFLLTRKIISPLIFPAPEEVIKVILAMKYTLILYAWVTFYRILIGFAIGTSLGILVGLFMTYNSAFYAAVNPHIQSFRPIPPTVSIPFFLIWFGISLWGRILFVAVGIFMILVIATIEAVRNVPPVYVEAAYTLGADKKTVYKTVILPAIIPHLIGSIRISIAMAFVLGIAAELMGAQEGIGFMVMVANRMLQTDTMLLGALIVGVIAAISDRIIQIGGNYITRWSER